MNNAPSTPSTQLDRYVAACQYPGDSAITVERQYQSGGYSTFRARSRAELVANLEADRARQRESGDTQGVTYTVPDVASALRLGAYETGSGTWNIRAYDPVLYVDYYYPIRVQALS